MKRPENIISTCQGLTQKVRGFFYDGSTAAVMDSQRDLIVAQRELIDVQAEHIRSLQAKTPQNTPLH